MVSQEQNLKIDYKNLTVVFILWDDAEADNTWKDAKERCKVKECKTIGFLLHEDERQVVVTNTLAYDIDISGDIAIPKGMIKEIKKYKL